MESLKGIFPDTSVEDLTIALQFGDGLEDAVQFLMSQQDQEREQLGTKGEYNIIIRILYGGIPNGCM